MNRNPLYNTGITSRGKNGRIDTVYPETKPLLSKLIIGDILHVNQSFAANVRLIDTALVNKMLQGPDAKHYLPKELRFIWAKTPFKAEDGVAYLILYALKTYGRTKAELNGSYVKSAFPTSGSYGDDSFVVSMDFNSEGGRIWKNMTSRNIDKCIAVCLNDQVLSAPKVMEPISGGNTQISGNFSAKEANSLANSLALTSKKDPSWKILKQESGHFGKPFNITHITLYILFGSLGMAFLYVLFIFLSKGKN